MYKTIRIIMAAFWLLAAMSVSAQDQRQRKPETIVQDVLAQMPTQNHDDFEREIGDLAKGAPQTVTILCRMLQPAEKACNNMVEYAISGVVSYASGHTQYAGAVRQAIEEAVSSAPDQTAKEFLQSQLRLIASDSKAIEYTAHAGAAPYAQLYDDIKAAGGNCTDIVLKALKSKDRAYRMQALKLAADYADDATIAKVCKKYKSLSDEGKEDVLGWLGDNKAVSQLPLVLKEIEKGKATTPMAIETAGRIGGDEAITALLAALQTDYSAQALNALKSVKGNLSQPVMQALQEATGEQKLALLSLAQSRRIKAVTPVVLEMVESNDATLADAALKALPGVITAGEVDKAASLLDKAADSKVADFQKVFMAAVNDLAADQRYSAISKAMKAAKNPARLYPALASTATDQSVSDLQQAWEKGDAQALQALVSSTNYKAAAPLLKAAQQGNEQALSAYVGLVETNETDADTRTNCLAKAMECAKTAASKTRVLNSLGATATRNSFILVGKSLDDKEVAYTAALAQKDIARKCLSDIDYKMLQADMDKCIAILEAHGKATGNPDGVYAVGEIKKMLAEVKPSPVYVLTEEEQKAGFEILFDGTNLDKWTGNKVGYIVVNGVIYVTANYGNESNLYTVNEYRDFVFRFDFCFTKPGVNNGVGIRTPMGVDAAYYGMCECQILDHDDPIYAGLHEYQVHGSAYGIIPAKRLKHKPLGEWSTEEIEVKGDHIKVTVNGEVILDGNLREACQGHNVAPDGSDTNPYTVDHRNHPGMFNKTGHIGFLGHGEGLKFRNVRVLDLSKKTKK